MGETVIKISETQIGLALCIGNEAEQKFAPFAVEKDVTTRKFKCNIFFVKRKVTLKSYWILVNVHSVRLCVLRYPVGTICPDMHKCIHAHSLHVHSRMHQIVHACAEHTVHLWRIFCCCQCLCVGRCHVALCHVARPPTGCLLSVSICWSVFSALNH